jgi:predicted GH43/DUF377 family glycosyl hydrolase
MLYRAAGSDLKHVIHFGLATSDDGFNFERHAEPAFSPSENGMDAGCVEDPRIVKIGQYYYITYASRPFASGQYWLHEGQCYKPSNCPEEWPVCMKENLTTSHLAITKDFKAFTRLGMLTDPNLDDRDVFLFPEKVNGQFVMIHRPLQWCGEKFGSEHPAIWISKSDDLLGFKNSKLLAQAEYKWEHKVGGNTPPIKTAVGWLMLYHAVGRDKYYRLGAMLLDLNDPSIVKYRTRDWIFQPEEDYETNGYYFGGGVVFPCGAVVINGELFVYYGAADKYVGVATCKLDDILNYLLQCPV